MRGDDFYVLSFGLESVTGSFALPLSKIPLSLKEQKNIFISMLNMV